MHLEIIFEILGVKKYIYDSYTDYKMKVHFSLGDRNNYLVIFYISNLTQISLPNYVINSSITCEYILRICLPIVTHLVPPKYVET
jgi:hypothetical protein